MAEHTVTGNSGVLKVYGRCYCCARCETFLDETVVCVSCGEPCSCEGCIADTEPASPDESETGR